MGELSGYAHTLPFQHAGMLKSLLVTLMLLCAVSLSFTQTMLMAFRQDAAPYALITTPELDQFDTSDLGKTPGHMLHLAREYSEDVLDIQISMPVIADSLIGDAQPLRRNDTFKLIFCEEPGKMDDFTCENRRLLSGERIDTFSLGMGECIISDSLAQKNGIMPGDTLTLVHYFNWSFRFSLVVRDVFVDDTRPSCPQIESYTSRRNEIIAHMDTLLSHARIVSILQSRQVHAQYLVRRNDKPVAAQDAPYVLPLSHACSYLTGKISRSAMILMQLFLLLSTLLLAAYAFSALNKGEKDKEVRRVLRLHRAQVLSSTRMLQVARAALVIAVTFLLYPHLSQSAESWLQLYNGSRVPMSAGIAVPLPLIAYVGSPLIVTQPHPLCALLCLPWLVFVWLSGRIPASKEPLLLQTNVFTAPRTTVYCPEPGMQSRLLTHNDAFTVVPDIHLTVKDYLKLFGRHTTDTRSMDALPDEESIRIQLGVARSLGQHCIVILNRSHLVEDHPELFDDPKNRWIFISSDILLSFRGPVWGWRENRLVFICEPGSLSE